MLEAYIMTNGSFQSRRLFHAEVKEISQDPTRRFNVGLTQRLVDTEKRGFYMQVLTTLMSRGQAANAQMFYITLLINFRGLSRSGMKMLSALNCCIPIATYDMKLKTYVDLQKTTIR